jgi:hypothetical protein
VRNGKSAAYRAAICGVYLVDQINGEVVPIWGPWHHLVTLLLQGIDHQVDSTKYGRMREDLAAVKDVKLQGRRQTYIAVEIVETDCEPTSLELCLDTLFDVVPPWHRYDL